MHTLKKDFGFIYPIYLIIGIIILILVSGVSYYLGFSHSNNNLANKPFSSNTPSGKVIDYDTPPLHVPFTSPFGVSFEYPSDWQSAYLTPVSWAFDTGKKIILGVTERDKSWDQVTDGLNFEDVSINGKSFKHNKSIYLFPFGTKMSRTFRFEFRTDDEKVIQQILSSIKLNSLAAIDFDGMWDSYSNQAMKLNMMIPAGYVEVKNVNVADHQEANVVFLSDALSKIKSEGLIEKNADGLAIKISFYPNVSQDPEQFGRSFLGKLSGKTLSDLVISSTNKTTQGGTWYSIGLVGRKDTDPSYDFIAHNGGIVVVETMTAPYMQVRYVRENGGSTLVDKIKSSIRFEN